MSGPTPPDRRGSRNPYVEPSELEGECDRCGEWTKFLRDALCSGCYAAEARVVPARVPADEVKTPGLRVDPSESYAPVANMMRRERERHAEAEKDWKPRSREDCGCIVYQYAKKLLKDGDAEAE